VSSADGTTSGSTEEINAHAPRVGFFKRVLGPLHYSGVFWLRFHYSLVTNAPDWVIACANWFCVRSCYVLLPSVRRALATNQDLAMGSVSPRQTRKRVLKSLDAFAWCLAERWERFEGSKPIELRYEGREHCEKLLASDQGILMITGHVGMWEAASRVAADESAREVHLVREREMDAGAQSFLEKLLARSKCTKYVTHFADDPVLGIELMNALRDGNLVALQGDRPRRGGRSLEVKVFGRTCHVPDGPAILARSTGCPLLPVFARREGRRRYVVRFFEPLISLHTRDRAADNRTLIDAYVRDLESAIRTAPEQWFKFGG
jgi:lauroyl/myristoyl acyltransferase